MKIKQLHLNRYGPPLASGLDVNMDDFTLVWGNNEDGKTLAIEAMLKLFYGSGASSRIFHHIDRVDEQPEGYVVLEDEEGQQHKISGDETLEDLLDVSPRECRNIFVIRDGDLSMSEQGEFFASVTDRLTGLRTSEITELREQIIDQARLKPGGTGYSNRQEDDKLEDRVEEAEDLLEEIDELEDEVAEQELDELEKRRVRLKEELQRTNDEIRAQEDAEKRERYEKARRALDGLEEALEKVRELSDYTQEKWQQWRDS
ncbi:MAG: AAA family ATPase, partial [Planctomycetota bacterium]